MSFIDHSNQLCEGCLLGKHAQKKIPKEATKKAKKPLELIHANVCDPIHPNSLGKDKCFLLVIDKFS